MVGTLHLGDDHMVALRVVQVLRENGYQASLEHRKPDAFVDVLGAEYYLLETNADIRIAEGLLLLYTRQVHGDEGPKKLKHI